MAAGLAPLPFSYEAKKARIKKSRVVRHTKTTKLPPLDAIRKPSRKPSPMQEAPKPPVSGQSVQPRCGEAVPDERAIADGEDAFSTQGTEDPEFRVEYAHRYE